MLLNSNSNQKTNLVKNIRVCKLDNISQADWGRKFKDRKGEDKYFLAEYINRYLSREETENVSEDNTEKEKIAGGSYEK
jgi:hypothetical protein